MRKQTAFLYTVLKIPAKIAFIIWCRNLQVNKKEIPDAKGPLLIAANHPNSFLDAVLLCTIFNKPVYSLARGDAFTNNRISKLLRSFNMFPVYRISEGAENLEENYKTFDNCLEVFKQNGIVLIFSEGRCVNEWQLRPLKKGTARLAISAWDLGIPLKIIPAGINYNSFGRFGKNVILNFGEIITNDNIPFNSETVFGSKVQLFNSALNYQLEKLVVQIKPADKNKIGKTFKVPVPALKKILLFVPAVLGYLLHAPLYIPLQKIAYKKLSKSGHYNAVLLGLLFFSYPLYLLIIALALYFLVGGMWWISAFFLMPFMAWSLVQLKQQT